MKMYQRCKIFRKKIIFINCQITFDYENDITKIENYKSEIFNWFVEGAKRNSKKLKKYIYQKSVKISKRFNFVNLFCKKKQIL